MAFFHVGRRVGHDIEPELFLCFEDAFQDKVVVGMVAQCVDRKKDIHRLIGIIRQGNR